MKHIFIQENEIIDFIRDFINKNLDNCFENYIKEIAKQNKKTIKEIREIYQLPNNGKLGVEMINKYSKEYLNVDIHELKKDMQGDINKYYEKYIKVFNTHIFEIGNFTFKLNKMTIENLIDLLEWAIDYSELDTAVYLFDSYINEFKLQKICKELNIKKFAYNEIYDKLYQKLYA